MLTALMLAVQVAAAEPQFYDHAGGQPGDHLLSAEAPFIFSDELAAYEPITAELLGVPMPYKTYDEQDLFVHS